MSENRNYSSAFQTNSSSMIKQEHPIILIDESIKEVKINLATKPPRAIRATASASSSKSKTITNYNGDKITSF